MVTWHEFSQVMEMPSSIRWIEWILYTTTGSPEETKLDLEQNTLLDGIKLSESRIKHLLKKTHRT